MSSKYALNPHALVRFLEKDAKDFTKDDIIRYVTENEIEMINFRYPGADGRLKTLNFIINSLDHLDNILTCGERVDGSSLFPYIEAGSSDLYVLPRYRTAFLNPFSEIPAVDILCSFYTKDGKPLEMSPEYTMRKAHEVLKQVTGMEFHGLFTTEILIFHFFQRVRITQHISRTTRPSQRYTYQNRTITISPTNIRGSLLVGNQAEI